MLKSPGNSQDSTVIAKFINIFLSTKQSIFIFLLKKYRTTYQVSDCDEFYLNYYLIHLIFLDFSFLLLTFFLVTNQLFDFPNCRRQVALSRFEIWVMPAR